MHNDFDEFEYDENDCDDYDDEQAFASNGFTISDPGFNDISFENFSIDEPDILLDVPYVPSSDEVVNAMLDLAGVGANDRLYDLGCGDGRIVIAAAQNLGAKGIGVDIDPTRIAEAMENAGEAGVEFLVDFLETDLFDVNFSQASVVTLYLLDAINVELRPKLLSELRPGSRIVSHAFKMGDWQPDKRLRMGNIELYKWVVPADVAREITWQNLSGDTFAVTLEQKYQQITGKAWANKQPAVLTSALLQGQLLELIVQHQGSHNTERQLFVCHSDGSYQALSEN